MQILLFSRPTDSLYRGWIPTCSRVWQLDFFLADIVQWTVKKKKKKSKTHFWRLWQHFFYSVDLWCNSLLCAAARILFVFFLFFLKDLWKTEGNCAGSHLFLFFLFYEKKKKKRKKLQLSGFQASFWLPSTSSLLASSSQVSSFSPHLFSPPRRQRTTLSRCSSERVQTFCLFISPH